MSTKSINRIARACLGGGGTESPNSAIEDREVRLYSINGITIAEMRVKGKIFPCSDVEMKEFNARICQYPADSYCLFVDRKYTACSCHESLDWNPDGSSITELMEFTMKDAYERADITGTLYST